MTTGRQLKALRERAHLRQPRVAECWPGRECTAQWVCIIEQRGEVPENYAKSYQLAVATALAAAVIAADLPTEIWRRGQELAREFKES